MESTVIDMSLCDSIFEYKYQIYESDKFEHSEFEPDKFNPNGFCPDGFKFKPCKFRSDGFEINGFKNDKFEIDVSLTGAICNIGKIRFVVSVPDFVYVDSLIMHIHSDGWALMTENATLHIVWNIRVITTQRIFLKR